MKQREEDQFEQVPYNNLSENDLPAFSKFGDATMKLRKIQISWESETQEAFAGAVSADAVTDGEMSEES